MRLGIVVDSTCDLPPEFIKQHKITILPISIRVGDQLLEDYRDLGRTREFYTRYLGKGSNHDFESVPYTAEELEQLFLTRLVLEYDYVICLCVMSARSKVYEFANRASFQILTKYRPIREAAGIPGPFRLRVFDSKNLFAGQGVQVWELLRLVEEKVPMTALLARLEGIIAATYAYLVPNELYYMFTRARARGDKSVGWAAYTVGNALDVKPVARCWNGETGPVAKVRHFETATAKTFANVKREIERGLLSPYVNISYGGDAMDLTRLPGFSEMVATAEARGVQVGVSHMSMTGGVNVGPHALTVGMIAQAHEFT
jgi:DegV family protein with EDD domain